MIGIRPPSEGAPLVTSDAFLEATKVYRSAVEGLIKDYLARPISGIAPLDIGYIEDFHRELCADYPSRGGKYLRSSLLILTAEAMGQSVEKTFQTAAAMEVSQCWLLIHDDLEDGSIKRRGEPTLHLKYSLELANNAGDALHLVMWKMLRDNVHILGSNKTLAIMDEFAHMLARTALGQTAELMFIFQNRYDFTEEDYYYIIDGKSGYYSVGGPLRLGAILATDNQEELEHDILPVLNEFGYNLGRAFQIVDDVLDLTSDFRGAKKQQGNDIYESKRTIMLAHLLEHASQSEKERTLTIYSKPRRDKSPAEVRFVLSLMESYGSIAYARRKAEEFAIRAAEHFEQIAFFINDEARNRLKLGIDFVLSRDF